MKKNWPFLLDPGEEIPVDFTFYPLKTDIKINIWYLVLLGPISIGLFTLTFYRIASWLLDGAEMTLIKMLIGSGIFLTFAVLLGYFSFNVLIQLLKNLRAKKQKNLHVFRQGLYVSGKCIITYADKMVEYIAMEKITSGKITKTFQRIAEGQPVYSISHYHVVDKIGNVKIHHEFERLDLKDFWQNHSIPIDE